MVQHSGIEFAKSARFQMSELRRDHINRMNDNRLVQKCQKDRTSLDHPDGLRNIDVEHRHHEDITRGNKYTGIQNMIL